MQISLALSPTNPLITGGGVPANALILRNSTPLVTRNGTPLLGRSA